MGHPPLLHDLAVVLTAPNQAWSAADGQMTGDGVQGVFCGDHRVLAAALLEVAGHVLIPTNRAQSSAHSVRFDYVLRGAEAEQDPALLLSRTREVTSKGVSETIRIQSRRDSTTTLDVRVQLRPDATSLATLRAGEPAALLPDPRPSWNWRDEHTVARLKATGAKLAAQADGLAAVWRVEVPSSGSASVEWALALSDSEALHGAAPGWDAPPLPPDTAADLAALLGRALSEVNALRMSDAQGNAFLAAGAPWDLTLSGRESLIAARFLLPLDRGLALSTLRALAAHQGRVVDDDSGERPGKIPQEIRREGLQLSDGTPLPAVGFGTVEATPLWVVTLHDAWRAGLDEASIVPLLDPLRAALGWLADQAESDGFIECPDPFGRELANPDGKDPTASVRFADGALAEGPLALVEMQGYAYAAARAGARLLSNFGRTAAERGEALFWDHFADGLSRRFRESFWVGEGPDRYPARALDGSNRLVDSVTSRIGQLIATGLLNREEEELVVRRLLQSDMFSGYGIRTLSADHPSFWPVSYQNGAVWTHDNALILDNMRRSGFFPEARVVAAAQLRAAEGFDYSLPELFGGQPAEDGAPPHPYPGSCRPQASAAAAAVPIARALGVQLG